MSSENKTGMELRPLFGSGAGGEQPLVIAGPCSAESPEQMMEAAAALSAVGIRFLRAGVWKPRTRPGSFEGIGAPALRWLVKAAARHHMVPLTEVANVSHLKAALRAGLRNFWIGARTTVNPFAVQEISDALAELPELERENISVLVKNPVNPDLELWIGALQRLYAAGITRLGAIHRGFSAYGEKLYRNRPEWRIPIELKRRIPQLPLICDPSHIAGKRELVGKVARRAIDMDYDGLIIESHCRPEEALSDSEQQLTPQEVGVLLASLEKREKNGSDACLAAFRDEIDNIDAEIVNLLARRMRVAQEIGKLKREHNIAVLQPDRYRALMEKRIDEAERLGLTREFMKKLFSTIHDESVNTQLQ